MATVRPAGGPGCLFTGYTHDFCVRPCSCSWPKFRAAAWQRRGCRAVRRYLSRPLAARPACANLELQPPVISAERKRHGVDDPDPHRNLRRTRDKRLPAGWVL